MAKSGGQRTRGWLGIASRMPTVGSPARWCAGLALLLAVGLTRPGAAEPPGVMTVAQYRQFLALTEQTYDERAARAVAVFFAQGALTQGYLSSECLRGQTVRQLRDWLRETAPAELTLLEALRLNGREHGCEARDSADVDAELAIQSGRRP